MYTRETSLRGFALWGKFALFAGMLAAGSMAHASTTLLLEEPFGLFGHMNPTGHAAIYLDHVCAETPTHLRLCMEGEKGVVISRYHRVDGYDWVAVPLIPYLYAVDFLDEIPETADLNLEKKLRDRYRRAHLETVAPDDPDGRAPDGEWIQLVGASYDRKIYGFQLASTPEQDAALIQAFNASRNVAHFNLLFHNCADFSRKVLNSQYPGAIHRNFIADFGLTTPKQVAHEVERYARLHPEVQYSFFVVPQVPGSIARSRRVDGIAESIVRSKKYVVPIAILSPIPTAMIAAAWLTGSPSLRLPKEAPQLAELQRNAPAGDRNVLHRREQASVQENEEDRGWHSVLITMPLANSNVPAAIVPAE